MYGNTIAASEVTNITATGFWPLVDDREYFVPFADYPIFPSATIGQIYNLRRIGPTQFHWPQLDADIELDALANPEKFPLKFVS